MGAPQRNAGKRKVLIVEDEFILALQEEQLLQDAGFEVVGPAADAATAVRLAEESRPDLVLMDIRLSGTRDGVDAAVEIWQRFGIRALFVTGNTEIAASERAKGAQPAGVIAKPYRDGDLLGAIEQALAAQ